MRGGTEDRFVSAFPQHTAAITTVAFDRAIARRFAAQSVRQQRRVAVGTVVTDGGVGDGGTHSFSGMALRSSVVQDWPAWSLVLLRKVLTLSTSTGAPLFPHDCLT